MMELYRVVRLVAGCLLIGVLFLASCTSEPPARSSQDPEARAVTYDAFGIEKGAYVSDDLRIRRHQTFSDILSDYNISPQTIALLAERSEPVFDVRRLRAGRPLHIYHDDSLRTAQVVVYQPDPVNYVVFDLRDSVHVYEDHRPVTVEERTVRGVITSSPYETFVEQGADPMLAIELSEVFAWQIDFYRIQEGDFFNVVYEERLVDGEPIGLGKVVAARFNHADKDFYAFYFEQDEKGDYFDEEGNSLRKAFLKAPLRYTRISSRYTKRRFHPVQKRYKAHLGTDYVAPTGTPIRATGGGVIVDARYGKYNGRFVKIRHNSTYTTGYLHMSRIAKGITPGVRVRQGQVIGYVGSTGLATGAHVCYRFWKNGAQVDPYKQEIPPSHPVADAHREDFNTVRDRRLQQLGAEESVQLAARADDEDASL